MKRIIYSTFTKLVAVVLLVATVLCAANIFVDAFVKFTDEKYSVYRFEDSFNDTDFFAWMLTEPADYINNAIYYYNNDKSEFEKTHPVIFYNFNVQGEPVKSITQDTDPADLFLFKLPQDTENLPNIPVQEGFPGTVEDYIAQELQNIYNLDKINYYIRVNDNIFTNNIEMEEEDYLASRFFVVCERGENGYVDIIAEHGTKHHNVFYRLRELSGENGIYLCVAVKEEFVEECEEIWTRQQSCVKDAFNKCVGFVILAIALFAYLVAVCGRRHDGAETHSWVDDIWTEVHIAAMVAFSYITAAGIIMAFEWMYDRPEYIGKAVILVGGGTGVLLVLNSFLSLIRKIKNKTFIEDSIIAKAIKLVWKIFVLFLKSLKGFFKAVSKLFYKKSVLIFTTLLFVYTCVIGICGIFTLETVAALFAGVAAFIFAGFFVAFRGKDLDEIRKGAQKIHSGELSYKIREPKSEDLKELADNINDIARGLDESVSAKLKAEKLKTDLITNVSHDLKTPLTSIISYTELLSKVEGLPDEANDYIEIIAKKSDRLKSLTQDLFDISKVQSGNENISLEKIDVSLLINQSLGEHDGEIEKSGLTLCVNVEKELCINADGRKMSRVMSNLISNILKYTMDGTRVFISSGEKYGKVIIELKNISSYPMDFDADEITARFVRGDESRTTEGNGLGLAIAKSYTEACGGCFSIVTDGDLFKVIIEFDKAE